MTLLMAFLRAMVGFGACEVGAQSEILQRRAPPAAVNLVVAHHV
jgi:hypothetical protein